MFTLSSKQSNKKHNKGNRHIMYYLVKLCSMLLDIIIVDFLTNKQVVLLFLKKYSNISKNPYILKIINPNQIFKKTSLRTQSSYNHKNPSANLYCRPTKSTKERGGEQLLVGNYQTNGHNDEYNTPRCCPNAAKIRPIAASFVFCAPALSAKSGFTSTKSKAFKHPESLISSIHLRASLSVSPPGTKEYKKHFSNNWVCRRSNSIF